MDDTRKNQIGKSAKIGRLHLFAGLIQGGNSMRRGFTLAEFVVALGIICILATILRPTCLGNSRHYASRAGCQSNLKMLGVAFQQYAQDYEYSFPATQIGESGWVDSIQPYTKGWAVFQCPENGKGRDTNLTDYFYNARLSKLSVQNVSVPVVTILGGDGDFDAPTNTAVSALPKGWGNDEKSPAFRHLGIANYLFADGHVKVVKAINIIDKKPKVNTGEYSFLP